LLAELISHAGNVGQSLVGAIAGISGAVGGKRSAEDERIINTINSLIPHVSTIVGHFQSGNINGIISTVLGALNLGGKRSAEELKIIATMQGHLTDILNHGQVIVSSLIQQLFGSIITTIPGKRSAEDVRIINTITTAFGNIWGSLSTIAAPHVDNLLAELISHAGNVGQSLVGAIAGISGAVGGKRSAEDERIINTITTAFGNIWGSLSTIAAPHVDNLLAELISHAGNVGQSLVGAIAGISGAVGGKRSAEEQKIIETLSGHLSEILSHGQVIFANLANQLLGNLLTSLPGVVGGKRQFNVGSFAGALQCIGQSGNALTTCLINAGAGILGGLIGGKRSAEDERIINTITTAFGNIWGSLSTIAAPHVDNLLAELISHAGNVGQSLVGAIAGISGAVGGY